MNWFNNNKYIDGLFNYKKDLFTYKEKVACFDLDGTLIKVKSKSKFPKDENDWEFYNDTVIKKLTEYYKKDYCLIIISNQGGIAKGRQDELQWKKKLEQICNKIKLPIKIFASKDNDIYRKPYMTLWNLIKNEIKSKVIDKESFYCGDACGRPGDHSDTDYKFALNSGIKFLTPETFFDGEEPSGIMVTYNVDFDKLKNTINTLTKIVFNKKEIIIMIGVPGSGKSTFVDKILIPLGYKRINMDTLKTKIKCIKECTNQVELGNSIVIDNTNPDSVTRKNYIDIAVNKGYNVKCIEMNCDAAVGYHNSHYRSYKSNGLTKAIPMLVYHKYKKIYEAPDKKEKINEIININFIPPADSEYYKYFY